MISGIQVNGGSEVGDGGHVITRGEGLIPKLLQILSSLMKRKGKKMGQSKKRECKKAKNLLSSSRSSSSSSGSSSSTSLGWRKEKRRLEKSKKSEKSNEKKGKSKRFKSAGLQEPEHPQHTGG